MTPSGLDRREFHQLTLAALGGVIAGSAIGCGETKPQNAQGVQPAPASPPTTSGSPASKKEVSLTAEAEAIIMDEPHTCRGLNSCEGKGRSKDNACAGQGTCASIADSMCGGHNDCKGQGGCGTSPGMNDCKGKGGCHIPLMDSAWTTARAAFETAMAKNDKKFGPAPAKKK